MFLIIPRLSVVLFVSFPLHTSIRVITPSARLPSQKKTVNIREHSKRVFVRLYESTHFTTSRNAVPVDFCRHLVDSVIGFGPFSTVNYCYRFSPFKLSLLLLFQYSTTFGVSRFHNDGRVSDSTVLVHRTSPTA